MYVCNCIVCDFSTIGRFCPVAVFFFQAEDGIRDLVRSRGLGDVYKRQIHRFADTGVEGFFQAVAGFFLTQVAGFDSDSFALSLIHI